MSPRSAFGVLTSAIAVTGIFAPIISPFSIIPSPEWSGVIWVVYTFSLIVTEPSSSKLKFLRDGEDEAIKSL